MSYIKADGFDAAIIGIHIESERVIYSKDRMINILMDDDMEYEDAVEFLAYNVWGAYVGENTPMYIDEMNHQEFQEYINYENTI